MEPHRPQGSEKEPAKETGRGRREDEGEWPPALLPPREEPHRAPAQGWVPWVLDQCCPEEALGTDTPGCLLKDRDNFHHKKKMKLDMIQQSYACACIWRKPSSKRYTHPRVQCSTSYPRYGTEAPQEEWMKETWHICTVEYYSAGKRNELMPSAATRMDLEISKPREVSQTGRDRYRMTSKAKLPLWLSR